MFLGSSLFMVTMYKNARPHEAAKMRFPRAGNDLNLTAMNLGEKRIPARNVGNKFQLCTRREFTKRSLAALPGAGLLAALSRLSGAETPAGKPNSKFAGVQLGLNVPYSFASGSMSGEDILKNCLQLGLSAVELRTQPVEAFLGVPEATGSAKAK